MDTNPFIHGTNASVLPYLPLTDFQLVSPVELITKYLVPPLSGEISGGGLSTVTSSAMTAFGRISDCNYNLQRVKTYTKMSGLSERQYRHVLDVCSQVG